MKGYVYKFTNKETGKWYIGSRQGEPENDDYIGSGRIWLRAVKKYGIESFNREILYIGENFREEETMLLEKLDAANDPMSYNMKNFAFGGPFCGNKNGMFGRKHTKESAQKCGNAFRGKKRPNHSQKMSGSGNPMYGKNDHAYGIVNRMKNFKGKTYDEIFGFEEAQKRKEQLSKSLKGKEKNLKLKICPHCGLEGRGPNMSRYHYDKCKRKTNAL